jgi:glyoxylase-like metal-dependent hydrolase (beta-lactamase superfamily II)
MQPLKVTVVPVTPFQQNCSIVVCTASNRAAIVDPGGDLPRITTALGQLKATPEKILLTHGHIDHAGAAAALAEELSIPIEGPDEADGFLLSQLVKQGERFGLTDVRNVTPARWLVEGETVSVGDLTFNVLHVPGHTPGHLVFVDVPARFALVGDTLFAGSVGRTDFPYGSHERLISGIKEKLLPLGDDMAILPGHGPATTIGRERQTNGFLQN